MLGGRRLLLMNISRLTGRDEASVTLGVGVYFVFMCFLGYPRPQTGGQ
jgi:hypothetical protein